NAGGGPSDLGGSRLGDTEGVFIPTGRELLVAPDIKTNNILELSVGQSLVLPVELYADGGVDAFGLVLAFNPEFFEINAVDAALGFGSSRIQEGILRISSLGAVPAQSQSISISVTVKQLPLQSMPAFRVLGESHVINGHGLKAGTYTVRMPKIKAISTKSISVYPNPASHNINVQFSDVPAGMYAVELISAAGQVIYLPPLKVETANALLPISLQDVVSGAYLLRLINNETGVQLSSRIAKM
ncbi:MAG TPA: T9SS type A sorting domain-containing protein, partial [Bacteroidales bacterium]|nr:T9SS type A sorting domain-containing protein [Bacteroidales bacterium]